ncbi:CPCC family cysteine-rich protein [Pseudomonas bharatica]|uniref:CPCC family cysteine-rich protein n=1 Tax=Pseudomonas bharatica TaxID=2692112 RepID=UPI003B28863B
MRYHCPCCEYLTFDESPPGTFEICPVCGWEDDDAQFRDPTYDGGANSVSLEQARINFVTIGASDKKFLNSVREPFVEEIPD